MTLTKSDRCDPRPRSPAGAVAVWQRGSSCRALHRRGKVDTRGGERKGRCTSHAAGSTHRHIKHTTTTIIAHKHATPSSRHKPRINVPWISSQTVHTHKRRLCAALSAAHQVPLCGTTTTVSRQQGRRTASRACRAALACGPRASPQYSMAQAVCSNNVAAWSWLTAAGWSKLVTAMMRSDRGA